MTIDLVKGHWQIPLSESELTAPVRLHGAPATFQRWMDQVYCPNFEKQFVLQTDASDLDFSRVSLISNILWHTSARNCIQRK